MTIFRQNSVQHRIRAILLSIGLILLGSTGVYGAAGPWSETEHGAVRLVAATDAVGSDESLVLGLHFRMKKGWKVYWRSPGDAGFPPQPNWEGSHNLENMSVDWPRPIRFDVQGLTTLGYKDEVLLPLAAKLSEPGKAVTVTARVPYLVCNEICVPYDAKLSLALPSGPETTAIEAGLIARYAALVPRKGAVVGLTVTQARVDGPPGKQILHVAANSTASSTPELLVEGPPGYHFAPPRLERREGGTVFLAAISPPYKSVSEGKPADLAGASLTLTLLTKDSAVEQNVVVVKGAAALPQKATGPPPAPMTLAAFLAILGFAVLGGLVLNLMPCVLPVLSLKMLSVIGHGGAEEKGPVRRGFLASAAGILVSFGVLASAAVILKSTGHAVGWGIQFQQPIFLTAMAVIVALFAANLWGLFEIRLPGGLADSAASVGHGHGLASHFATGAFAAVLATPCSAPFVGTAIGFALSRGTAEIYAIFLALGLGLALPYLLIAAAPSLATRLPRPGPWMITMKRILAIALIATAAWLLTVLAAQIGERAALLAAALVAAMLFVLWITDSEGRVSPMLSGGAVAALALAAILGPSQIAQQGGNKSVQSAQSYWKPFAPEAIAGHVAAGRTVFVDVTADWCVTCKVNKALVLDSPEIVKQLRRKDVIAMKADWTRPDPVISAFLERFGRYGIPFDVVFGPGAPEGRPLSELLTKGAVTAAIDLADGPKAVTRR
jgi:suppressor for copper-sensitivity B